MTRTQKRVTILAIVLALIGLAMASLNWNMLRGSIERRVTASTGREFVIDGNVYVRLAWTPRIRLEKLRLANADWAKDPTMLHLERVEFTLSLLDLLRGQVLMPEVEMQSPYVILERNSEGRPNWIFDKDEAARPPAEQSSPAKHLRVIGRLTIDTGKVVFRDPTTKTDITTKFATTAASKSGAPGIQFSSSGVYKAMKVLVDGRGGSILSITDTQLPYPFTLHAQVGATYAAIDGTVSGLAALTSMDATLNLRGDTLSALYPILSIPIAPTPPYKIAGRLVHSGNKWKFSRFVGEVGDSDLAGDMAITLRSPRPFMQAKLVSKVLDLDDLAGFVGAPPQVGPGETASRQQQSQAAAVAAGDRFLPNASVHLNRLREMDIDVSFDGKSIRNKKSPIEDLVAHLYLKQGVLKAEPLNFGVADGNVVSKIRLDATRDILKVNADIEVKKLHLNRLAPDSEWVKSGAGFIGGRVLLEGEGRSVATILASANGTIGLAMTGGRMSNLLLEIAGLDVAESIGLLFTGDKEVRLRCAVADFSVENGLMGVRTFVVDTTDTNLFVQGTLDLKKEALDLTLRPAPKDYSVLSLRTPLGVTGTLKNPRVAPRGGKLVEKTGLAALIATLVNPIAALIPLIETGPGRNSDCDALVAEVRRHAKAGANISP